MWTLIFVFFVIIKAEGKHRMRTGRGGSFVLFFLVGIEGLLCYQCSMQYSNEECNANNSTYATECQPSFDTCVTIVLKPGRRRMFFVVGSASHLSFSDSQSIIDHQILHETSCM